MNSNHNGRVTNDIATPEKSLFQYFYTDMQVMAPIIFVEYSFPNVKKTLVNKTADYKIN